MGQRLKEYPLINNFGFLTDVKLYFKKHTDEVTKSLKAKLAFFYRNKACITKNYRKQIVQSTFSSLMDYGDVIYMHSPASTLKPLDAVYQSA